MKVEEYISSGVLELYALDLLNKAERREVEQMLEQHAEVAEELKRIEINLQQYAEAHAEKPSNRVKENILSAIDSTSIQTIESKSKVLHLRWIAAAASVLLLISLGLNFYQINTINKVEKTLANLRTEQNILAEDYSNIKAKNEEIQKNLEKANTSVELFQNPNIQTVLIKGSDLSPNSFAYVNFNNQTKEVTLNGIDLPENGPKNHYQLWALVDGTPVDLGVFDSSDSLLKLTKTVDSPDAFAVTLQDRGGNETPNLEQLYLIGNV